MRWCLLLSVFCFGCPASATEEVPTDTDPSVGSSGGSSPSTGAADDTSSGSSGAVEGCLPTDAGVSSAVLVPKCGAAGCHDANGTAAGLDLTVADPSSLVGRTAGTCAGEVLVVAGDPAASFLVSKLGPTPACGDSMPPGQPLSADDVACLEAWVEQVQMSCETCGGPTCIDTNSDATHCGGCDQPCPSGVACVSGQCACPEGTAFCAGECVDTGSDPEHCGGCGQPCDAGLVCLEGACADGCGALSECNGACVDTQTNVLHCGGCDAPCGVAEACSAGMCGCAAAPTSYVDLVEPILVAQCATMGCHRPMGPLGGAEGLNLAAGAGYDSLVDVPSAQCGDRMRVAPGSPSQSYLMDKLLGVNLCGGTQMPKAGTSLAAGQIQIVQDWICAGAMP